MRANGRGLVAAISAVGGATDIEGPFSWATGTISNAFSATGGAPRKFLPWQVPASAVREYRTSGKIDAELSRGPRFRGNCARRFRTSHAVTLTMASSPCHTTAPCKQFHAQRAFFQIVKVAIECPVGDKLKELLAAAAALEGRACDDSLYMRAEGPGVWGCVKHPGDRGCVLGLDLLFPAWGSLGTGSISQPRPEGAGCAVGVCR